MGNKLFVPKPRTDYLKRSFSYDGAVCGITNSTSIGKISQCLLEEVRRLVSFYTLTHGNHVNQCVFFCLFFFSFYISSLFFVNSFIVNLYIFTIVNFFY